MYYIILVYIYTYNRLYVLDFSIIIKIENQNIHFDAIISHIIKSGPYKRDKSIDN